MKLSIMYPDDRVEEIFVRRVFTFVASNVGPCLYYETSAHMPGQGKSIRLSEIKCWEANIAVRDGSVPLSK